MASKDTTTLGRRLAVYGPYRRRSPLWIRWLRLLLVLLVLVAVVIGVISVIVLAIRF